MRVPGMGPPYINVAGGYDAFSAELSSMGAIAITARGSTEQVTSTTQVTSVNEPVSAAIQPAAETATVPASQPGASGDAKPGTMS